MDGQPKESEDIQAILSRKIDDGENWLKNCKGNLGHIPGVHKLVKKLKAELNFLKRLQAIKTGLKFEQIHCSNLLHLTSIIRTACSATSVTAVLQPFHYECAEGDSSSKIVVDVVSDNGRTWTKVVARNPHSMRQISIGFAQILKCIMYKLFPLIIRRIMGHKFVLVNLRVLTDIACLEVRGGSRQETVVRRTPTTYLFHPGQGQFGEKSILDHARDLMSCALVNQVCYSVPSVRICFYNGVTDEVAQELRQIGVDVKSELPDCETLATLAAGAMALPDSTQCILSPSQRHIIEDRKIKCLNLDVSTMLAYTSALTNGGAHYKFDVPVLSQQAASERVNPVKPILDALFQGRTLLCCETALKDFDNILKHIAGEKEKERGRSLLDRVSRIPDGDSPIIGSLKLGGKIRWRSLRIFGTGDAVQAVTVTANVGFVRAAFSQGVSIPVFIHESRALSEAKQRTN